MRSTSALAAAALLSACATSLPAPNAPAAPASVEVTSTGIPRQAAAERSLKLTAAVTAVDYAGRTITIKGEDGLPDTLKVPPEVRRLSEVAVGDTIEVELRQGLHLQYQPAGAAEVAPRDVAVGGWAGLSEPPAGSAATGRQSTVTITAIDLEGRLVTFQGPARNQYQVKVGPRLAIEKLEVGDRLVATYVQTVVLQVSKGGEKL